MHETHILETKNVGRDSERGGGRGSEMKMLTFLDDPYVTKVIICYCLGYHVWI